MDCEFSTLNDSDASVVYRPRQSARKPRAYRTRPKCPRSQEAPLVPHTRFFHRRVEARPARGLYGLDAAVAREEPLPSWSTTRGSSSCHGSRSPASARTSSPSSAGACPETGPSAMASPPCSSRPSSRRRATSSPSTGHRDGSALEPHRDEGATTGTERMSGCGRSAATGSKSSTAETISITPRPNRLPIY